MQWKDADQQGISKITDERDFLIALLLDMPLGPPAPVAGIAGLSTADKLRELSACCAQMIAAAVWALAYANKAAALEGIDSLAAGIKDNIKRRIDGQF